MWFDLSARLFSTHSRANSPRSVKTRSAIPVLEHLEDRSLLSSNPLVNANSWNLIGPTPITGDSEDGNNVTGRITALVADPNDTSGNTVYAGTAGGGVWMGESIADSTNRTWIPLTDNLATQLQVNDPYINLNVGALAAVQQLNTHNTILYAGLGEANSHTNLMTNSAALSQFYGTGIIKGVLNYQHPDQIQWTLLGGPGTSNLFYRSSIAKIIVDPLKPNDVYVAVSVGANGVTGHEGIWRSTDGGSTWKNMTATALPGSNQYMFSDLVMDPSTYNDAVGNQVLYAAIGEASGSPLNGVYVTVNGGQTWTLMSNLPHGLGVGRITLALSGNIGTSQQPQYELWAAFMTDRLTQVATLTGVVSGTDSITFSGFGSYSGNAQTSISSSSSFTLPQTTFNVTSTVGFPSSGTLYIQAMNGTGQQVPVTAQVKYTGTTATSFTGCSIVAGQGDTVMPAALVTSLPQSLTTSTLSKSGQLTLASTLGFPSSGVLYIQTSQGLVDVTYQNLNGTTVMGCSLLSGKDSDINPGDPVSILPPITLIPHEYMQVTSADGTQEITNVKYNDNSPNTGTLTFNSNPFGTTLPTPNPIIQTQESTLLYLGYANIQGRMSDASASLIVNPNFQLPVPNDFTDNISENYVGNQGYYGSALAVYTSQNNTSPATYSETVYAGGMNDYLQILNADTSNQTANNVPGFYHVDHHAIAVLTPNGTTTGSQYFVLDGSDGGVWEYDSKTNASTNLNVTQNGNGSLAITQFYGIAVNPGTTAPGNTCPTPPSQLEVYGGVQDNGNARTAIPPVSGSNLWQSASNDDGSQAYIDSTQTPENVFLSHAGLLFSNVPGSNPFQGFNSQNDPYYLNLDANYGGVFAYVPQPGAVDPTKGYGNSGGIGDFPGVAYLMQPVASSGIPSDYLWYGGNGGETDGALWFSPNGGYAANPQARFTGSSNGNVLPMPGAHSDSISVNSTFGFPSSGTLWIQISPGTTAQVTYTGTSPTAFTGCNTVVGGGDQLAPGDIITNLPPTSPTSDEAIPAPGSDSFTITVNNVVGFPSSNGVLNIQTSQGTVVAQVTYTNTVGGNTFTGCRTVFSNVSALSTTDLITSSPQTSITSTPSPDSLPATTPINIYVASTLGFSPNGGELAIEHADGTVATVTYKGTGSDSTGQFFSGCMGSQVSASNDSFTLQAGDHVTIPWYLIGSPNLNNGWIQSNPVVLNGVPIDNTPVDSIGANSMTPTTVYAGLRGGHLLVTQNAPLAPFSSLPANFTWTERDPVTLYSTNITTPSSQLNPGGQALVQATIKVGSTKNFPSAGTLFIQTANGPTALVTYTGMTATSFTGCSGAFGLVLEKGDTVTFQNDLRFSDILVDPQNPNVAYVTASNFGDVTGGGHIWLTTDAGRSWMNISNNLPNVPAWSIQAQWNGTSTTNPTSVLYVGTDLGIYASANGGKSWLPYGTGLPDVQVRSMSLSQNPQYPAQSVLVIGTWGHGAYELPLAPAVNVQNNPVTIPYSSQPQKITVSTPVQFGSTLLTSGLVTFSLVPVGGSTPVAMSPQVSVNQDGTASVSWTLPAALPPGSYSILVSYEATSLGQTVTFPFSVSNTIFNLKSLPPNRAWSR